MTKCNKKPLYVGINDYDTYSWYSDEDLKEWIAEDPEYNGSKYWTFYKVGNAVKVEVGAIKITETKTVKKPAKRK